MLLFFQAILVGLVVGVLAGVCTILYDIWDMTFGDDDLAGALGRSEVAEGMERGRAEGVERGLAEGVAQGRVALLCRLAARRFGVDVARQAGALLADVTDVARLDEAGEWLLECDTGDALLARLGPSRDGAGNGVPG